MPKKKRAPAPAPPTLGDELRGPYRWLWFECPRCLRRSPRALVPYAIRYGFDATAVALASSAVCVTCGHRGALLKRPSMIGTGRDLCVETFPAELATRGLERWLARVTRTPCPAPLRMAFRRSS
jgi:hypothetical protein